MDADNFKFTMGKSTVEMIAGRLYINDVEYEADEDGENTFDYDAARRLAFEGGCFPDDADLPAIIVDK